MDGAVFPFDNDLAQAREEHENRASRHMPAAELPLSPSSYIEIELVSATVRVHGLVDAKMLGVVLDCLARRT